MQSDNLTLLEDCRRELLKQKQDIDYLTKLLKLEKDKTWTTHKSRHFLQNANNSSHLIGLNLNKISDTLLNHQEPDLTKKSLKALKDHLEQILFNNPPNAIQSHVPSDLAKYILEIKRLKLKASSELIQNPEVSNEKSFEFFSLIRKTKNFEVFSKQSKKTRLSQDFQLKLKNFDLKIKKKSLTEVSNFIQIIEQKFELSEKISRISEKIRETFEKFRKTKKTVHEFLSCFHRNFEELIEENIKSLVFYLKNYVKTSDFNELQSKFILLFSECEVYKNQVLSLGLENQKISQNNREILKNSEESLKIFIKLQADHEKTSNLLVEECSKSNCLLMKLMNEQRKNEELGQVISKLESQVLEKDGKRPGQFIERDPRFEEFMEKMNEKDSKIQDLIKRNHEKDSEIQNLVEKMTELNKVAENLKNSQKPLEKQVAFKAEDQSQRIQQVHEENKEMESLITENMFLNKKVERLKKDLDYCKKEMQSEITSLNDINNQLLWKLEKFSDSKNAPDGVICDFLAQFEAEKQEILILREELNQKNKDESYLKLNLDSANEKVMSLKYKLDLLSDENTLKIIHLESKLSSLQDENTCLKKDFSSLQSLYEKEQSNINQVSKQLQNRHQELEDINNSSTSLKLENSELKRELSRVSAANFQLETLEKALKSQNSSLENSLNQLNSKLVATLKNLEEKNVEIQDIFNQLTSKSSKILKLKKKLEIQVKKVDHSKDFKQELQEGNSCFTEVSNMKMQGKNFEEEKNGYRIRDSCQDKDLQIRQSEFLEHSGDDHVQRVEVVDHCSGYFIKDSCQLEKLDELNSLNEGMNKSSLEIGKQGNDEFCLAEELFLDKKEENKGMKIEDFSGLDN